jgi:hypothetical protein
MTATAGNDLLLALPALISQQTKIRKEERNRSMPVDLRYPRTLSWNIIFPIPAGYSAKGIESLNQQVSNDCGSFISNAKVENNNLVIDVRKMYRGNHFELQQWSKMLEVLDAAYNFSQSKIVLKKQ